jgi:hypothetical protein
MRYMVLIGIALLAPGGLASCTAGDREAMFSSDRAPLVGRCDPQPGYPPPSERPGCEYRQYGGGGRGK